MGDISQSQQEATCVCVSQRLWGSLRVGGGVLGYPHCLLANCSISGPGDLLQRTGGQGQLGPRWGGGGDMSLKGHYKPAAWNYST